MDIWGTWVEAIRTIVTALAADAGLGVGLAIVVATVLLQCSHSLGRLPTVPAYARRGSPSCSPSFEPSRKISGTNRMCTYES